MSKDTANSFDHSEDKSLDDDERVLIEQIQKGSARAFKTLMREYFGELADFAFYYIKSSHVARDVVQDVFTNIWRNRSSWNPTRSLKMYLYRAVKNEALKYLRDKKTERKYLQLFTKEKKQKVSPEKIEQSNDFKQEVRCAVEDLPERARIVYKLHRREGLTYKEIAEVMEISHKTVESQMSRALKKLRNRLSSKIFASH